MFTDAELALMPEDERVRISRTFYEKSTEDLAFIAGLQDLAERNQNYRFDDDDDDRFGGWDCD